MKIVRVTYTTRPGYVASNQANIANIVEELRELDHPGIKYGAYLLPDGKTFMHFDQFESEAAHAVLTGLESFKKFATELEASEWEVEPKLELLSLVASNDGFFG
jgi:quinol monooxygenase YgiN